MYITITLVDMRFFDREQEFEKLREIEELSHEVAQFTIITGRRRIGKTEMVKKFYENKTMLYFFVARKAEADLCNIFVDEIRTKLNIPMLDSKGMSFAAVFKFIMELSQTQHINLFIDEFQDFYRVNPSIYSDMQNIWDSCKNKAHINLIVAGSVNTLMNKIFKDKKQPLFGRQTETMHVRPFKPSVLKEIMSEYCPGYKKSDLLALYTLTGGVAKYVELFIDRKKFTEKKMMDMFFEHFSEKDYLFGPKYWLSFSIASGIIDLLYERYKEKKHKNDENDFVVAAECPDVKSAESICNKLEANGIKAMVVEKESPIYIKGSIEYAEAQVQVCRKDLQKAQELNN